MKKLFSILMVAFALTAMVACEKETKLPSESGGNGNGNEPTLNIEDNTLVYDGITYHMDTRVESADDWMTQVYAYSQEKDTNGESIVVYDASHIVSDMFNTTVDLVSPDMEYGIYFWFSDGSRLNAYYSPDVDENSIGGQIFDVDYEHESIFTRGTYSIKGNNDGTPITIILDGTLKNGKTIQMKLISDSYEIIHYSQK